MISYIGDEKFNANKILKIKNCTEPKIQSLIFGSSLTVIDINDFNVYENSFIRFLIESNKVVFTKNSFEKIKLFIDNIFHTQVQFKCLENVAGYKIEVIDIYNYKDDNTKANIYNEVKSGITEVYQNKSMLFKSAYSSFKLETKNTSLGSYWHIVRDIMFFFTYITFMSFIRGNADIENIPSILYLVSGLVPWYFMSDIFNSGVSCIRSYKHVISKVKFPITIIPFYNTIGNFYKRSLTYLILAIIILYYILNNEINQFNIFYFIYFNIAMVLFMMSFSLVFSSLISVSKDFSELYKSIQRVQFYFIPVFWDFTLINSKLTSINPIQDNFLSLVNTMLLLNPVAYILNGFRMCIGATNHITIFNTVIFWIITFTMFIIGFSLQYRLRKIYADVL